MLGFPRKAARRLSVSLTLTVLASLAVVANAAPASAAIQGVFGPDCPDVMVIAARGSGEQPQPPKSWTDPADYATDTFHGAGAVNTDLYDRLWQAAPQLHFSLDPVEYPANPVTFPGIVREVKAYTASVESGASRIVSDIDLIEHRCGGGVKYLFTGYSQGAWTVHQALWKLARTRKVQGKIVGVALFGDPEFRPGETIVRDFKRTLHSQGSAVGFDRSNAGVPADLESVSGSYCFFSDPVCQTNAGTVSTVVPWCIADPSTTGICPHYRYVTDGETAKAAQFLRPKLPSRSVWPRLTLSKPPTGTVGKAYRWRATVTPTERTSYMWEALEPEPPGLKLGTDGVLSGTPTVAGTFTFRFRTTSKQGRIASGRVTVVIQPGAGPPPPPPPPPAGTGDWTQKQFGPDRSGVNATDTAITATNAAGLRQVWEYSASDVVLPRTPVTAGGIVFEPVQTTGLGGRLVALSLATGAVLWQQTLDGVPGGSAGIPGGSAAVAGHTVVVQTNHTLYGFDTTTGAPQWTLPLPAAPSAPAVVGDTVYVTTSSGVAAVTASTGAARWQASLSGACAAPAVTGGKLFALCWPTQNGQVNALDAATGSTLWSHPFTQPYDGNLSVGHGMVYVTSQFDPPGMAALDQATGALRWQHPMSAAGKTPTITANAILVGADEASGVQHCVTALDPVTGATIWSQQYSTFVNEADIAVANGLGFMGTQSGTLGVIRVDTGALVTEIKVGPGTVNDYSPIISAGTVLVAFPGIVGNTPPVPPRFVALRLP